MPATPTVLYSLLLLGLEELALCHQEAGGSPAWRLVEIQEAGHTLTLMSQPIEAEDILLFRRLIEVIREQGTPNLSFAAGGSGTQEDLRGQILALATVHLHLHLGRPAPPPVSLIWHGLFDVVWVDNRQALVQLHLDPLLYPLLRLSP